LSIFSLCSDPVEHNCSKPEEWGPGALLRFPHIAGYRCALRPSSFHRQRRLQVVPPRGDRLSASYLGCHKLTNSSEGNMLSEHLPTCSESYCAFMAQLIYISTVS